MSDQQYQLDQGKVVAALRDQVADLAVQKAQLQALVDQLAEENTRLRNVRAVPDEDTG